MESKAVKSYPAISSNFALFLLFRFKRTNLNPKSNFKMSLARPLKRHRRRQRKPKYLIGNVTQNGWGSQYINDGVVYSDGGTDDIKDSTLRGIDTKGNATVLNCTVDEKVKIGGNADIGKSEMGSDIYVKGTLKIWQSKAAGNVNVAGSLDGGTAKAENWDCQGNADMYSCKGERISVKGNCVIASSAFKHISCAGTLLLKTIYLAESVLSGGEMAIRESCNIKSVRCGSDITIHACNGIESVECYGRTNIVEESEVKKIVVKQNTTTAIHLAFMSLLWSWFSSGLGKLVSVFIGGNNSVVVGGNNYGNISNANITISNGERTVANTFFARPNQLLILSQNSTVGDVEFEGVDGKVYLYDHSQITGTVTGGVVIKK